MTKEELKVGKIFFIIPNDDVVAYDDCGEEAIFDFDEFSAEYEDDWDEMDDELDDRLKIIFLKYFSNVDKEFKVGFCEALKKITYSITTVGKKYFYASDFAWNDGIVFDLENKLKYSYYRNFKAVNTKYIIWDEKIALSKFKEKCVEYLEYYVEHKLNEEKKLQDDIKNVCMQKIKIEKSLDNI